MKNTQHQRSSGRNEDQNEISYDTSYEIRSYEEHGFS